MVRLQPSIQELFNEYGIKVSQFHYGSITTNSIKDLFSEYNLTVSIPLWFDYN